MNFQEKLIETTADLRAQATSFAAAALANARVRAKIAAKRVEGLKGSFASLTVAGRELNKVARRHAVRFVKENSTIAAQASKDLSTLARATYATLATKPATSVRKTRKAPAARKRAASKAA